jgi:hypothetical protein
MNQGLEANYSTKECISIQIIKIFSKINRIVILKRAIEVQTEAFSNNKISMKDNTDDKIRNFFVILIYLMKKYFFK